MSNLRLWGYEDQQNTDQTSIPLGLLEKINKLKEEITKLKEEDNKQIEFIETTLKSNIKQIESLESTLKHHKHHKQIELIESTLYQHNQNIIIQISSKKQKIKPVVKFLLMNNEPEYEFPISLKRLQIKIYCSHEDIRPSFREFGFRIFLDSIILIQVEGPFPKLFDIGVDIVKGQKICFMANKYINSGFYCELIGQV